MDEIERIEEERFVEAMISLWIQQDAPEWIIDYVRQELRKQRGLSMNERDIAKKPIRSAEVRCGMGYDYYDWICPLPRYRFLIFK